MKTRRPKPPAAKKQAVANRRRKSLAGLMPLEPRVMYDAAGAHTAASHLVLDPHHTDTAHAASTTSASPSPIHAASSQAVTSTPAAAANGPNLTSSNGGQGTVYVVPSPPQLIDTGFSITDTGTNQITEATVEFVNTFIAGDVFAFNNSANNDSTANGSTVNKETFSDGKTINGTYNAATGILTLTGTASSRASRRSFPLIGSDYNPTALPHRSSTRTGSVAISSRLIRPCSISMIEARSHEASVLIRSKLRSTKGRRDRQCRPPAATQ